MSFLDRQIDIGRKNETQQSLHLVSYIVPKAFLAFGWICLRQEPTCGHLCPPLVNDIGNYLGFSFPICSGPVLFLKHFNQMAKAVISNVIVGVSTSSKLHNTAAKFLVWGLSVQKQYLSLQFLLEVDTLTITSDIDSAIKRSQTERQGKWVNDKTKTRLKEAILLKATAARVSYHLWPTIDPGMLDTGQPFLMWTILALFSLPFTLGSFHQCLFFIQQPLI